MRYLFYKINRSGEATEVIGTAEAVNSVTALGKLTNTTDPFDTYDPREIRCVVVTEILSGEDIEQGTV